jgi:C_GCAxxG_C_C family probable redox protein
MRKMNNQERIEKAVALFREGCNCSQSVTVAFADLYGFTEEQAMRLSASFGGGIGRMRGTCGAACGMFILAGMDCGSTEPSNREAKSYNYKVVQRLAAKFKEQTGSLICAELLGLKSGTPLSSMASERTKEYYEKRPCPRMIETAAKIFAEYLDNK